MTVKLNLIFIVMDLITLFIYPFVFIHGWFRRFGKSKEAPLPRMTLPVALITINK